MKTLRTTDDKQPQERLAWVKACRHLPMFERPGRPEVTNHVRHRWNHVLTNGRIRRERRTRRSVFMLRWRRCWQQRRDSPHKRRMHTQELIRHILKPCVARALQGRAPRGDMARQVIDALPKPQKEETRGMMSMAPAKQKALCRKDW